MRAALLNEENISQCLPTEGDRQTEGRSIYASMILKILTRRRDTDYASATQPIARVGL
jgi:hypothetical protein